MTPVSIFVVYIQDFSFFVATPLALVAPFFNKTPFKHSLVLHFIFTRTTNLIQIANPTFVRAGPATGFFIRARKNQGSAHPTGNFFPISFPITLQTTEYPSLA